MGQLDSRLTPEDVETLLDSISDWEMVGNQEYYIMNMVRSIPMPAEENDTFEAIKGIKEHFRTREKEIKESRAIRQEKAIFLKAKLLLAKRDAAIDKLFDPTPVDIQSTPPKKEPGMVEDRPTILPFKDDKSTAPDFAQRLVLAEEYIKDVGIWKNYTTFLADRGIQVQP
jgi:hypothetical protein